MKHTITRCCTRCKETKDIWEFVKCSDNKTGYRSICKVCKNMDTKKFREVNPRKDRIKVIEQAEEKKEIPNLVPPRTFIYKQDSYKTETTYYRNDGNKHIQSKGFRT